MQVGAIASRCFRAREVLFARAQCLTNRNSLRRPNSGRNFLHVGTAAGNPRSSIVLTTKYGNPWSAPGTSPYFLRNVKAFVGNVPSSNAPAQGHDSGAGLFSTVAGGDDSNAKKAAEKKLPEAAAVVL